MTDSPFKLTPEEIKRVESGHRELMRLQAMDIKPIPMPVDSKPSPIGNTTDGHDADEERPGSSG